jgi:hypothetical protein
VVAAVRQAPFEMPVPVPELKQRQRVLLQSYGWVDRQRGVVHIPVKRAIDLVLEQAQGQPPVKP